MMRRLRLSVFRSNKKLYVQVIDDKVGKTLAAASGVDPEIVGKEIAKKAKARRIKKVVFDRGHRRYHGKIKALAEAARKEGLEF
jgi:large subunit ribosomal protein L18